MKRLILDVDTGLDDAVALLLAAGLEELHIEAVIATAGNVGLEKTLENTLNIMETVGATCPVYKGADKPLLRESVEAGDFHGVTGMDGPTFPPRKRQQVQEESGIDALIRLLKENPHQLSVVSVGPLTDLALAMAKEEGIALLAKEIVIMGGSFSYGNVTKAAEFNTYADPEAAQIVFSSGANITLFSLDCTRTVTLDNKRLEAYRKKAGRATEVFAACMDTYMANYEKKGQGWPQMHDPLCIAYLADPTKVECEYAPVAVDIEEGPTYGQTVKLPSHEGEQIRIARSIDIPWFWSLVERALDHLD